MKRKFKDLKLGNICFAVNYKTIKPVKVTKLEKSSSIEFTEGQRTENAFFDIKEEHIAKSNYNYYICCNQKDAIKLVKNSIKQAIINNMSTIEDLTENVKDLTEQLNSY